MSEVAGRMRVQVGANYLETNTAAAASCWAASPALRRRTWSSSAAASSAPTRPRSPLGMGANVTILDMNLDRLRYLDDVFSGRVHTLSSNRDNIARSRRARPTWSIGAVLIPGAAAPKLVTRDMVSQR